MEDSVIRTKYMQYKNSAKKRNLVFDISLFTFTYKIQQPCYICGKKSIKGSYNGLDRVDNKVGYVKHNLSACCWNCNRSKSNLPVEEFKNWITNFGEVKDSLNYREATVSIWENKDSSSDYHVSLVGDQRKKILNTIWDNIRAMSEYGFNDGNDIFRAFKVYDFIMKFNLEVKDFIVHFIRFVDMEKNGEIKSSNIEQKLDPIYVKMMLQEFGIPK